MCHSVGKERGMRFYPPIEGISVDSRSLSIIQIPSPDPRTFPFDDRTFASSRALAPCP